MKHLKKKLAVATSMMLLAAVMLSSVSYAWYTLSTNPEIKGMSATVTANSNLEIALDNGYADEDAIDTASNNATVGGVQGSTTGNPYTWGNQVDLTGALAAAGVSLQPVTTNADDTKLQYPVYGQDGRLSNLTNTVMTKEVGPEYLETTGTKGVKGWGSKANGQAYAFSVTYWVRSNVAGDLQLSEATARTDGGEVGGGSTITCTNTEVLKNMKVAFQINDTGAFVPATTAVSGTTATVTCEDITALTANTAVKITMYIWLDGTNMTNAGAYTADATDAVAVNIQFANSNLTATNAATPDFVPETP